ALSVVVVKFDAVLLVDGEHAPARPVDDMTATAERVEDLGEVAVAVVLEAAPQRPRGSTDLQWRQRLAGPVARRLEPLVDHPRVLVVALAKAAAAGQQTGELVAEHVVLEVDPSAGELDAGQIGCRVPLIAEREAQRAGQRG